MRWFTVTSFALTAVVVIAAPRAGRAADGPATRATLDQLNRETTALYHQVQSGIYHVQLPQPKWVSALAMAGVDGRDKMLDLETRKLIEQAHGLPVTATEVRLLPATRSSEGDAATVTAQGTYILVRPQAAEAQLRDPVLGGELRASPPVVPGFAPNNIALLIDDEGDLIVPIYLERDAAGKTPIKLAGPDGVIAVATFIGSDRQTNLTLLHVDAPAGKPVNLASARPEPGSLVLCLSPTDGSGRLGLWTDGARDNGIIVDTQSNVCGIARYGQFLTGSACRLIARQLIQYGAVKRATLGVLITEISRDDLPLRQQPLLASRSAMRIDQVIADSVADKAGLKAGDLVLAVAGEAVSDLPSFAAAIAARDGPTQLRLLRGEIVLNLTVDLQQQK